MALGAGRAEGGASRRRCVIGASCIITLVHAMKGGSTMTDQAITSPDVQSGDEHPTHVSAEEYLAKYAHDHFEWDNGELIKMSPVTEEHYELDRYLTILFSIY